MLFQQKFKEMEHYKFNKKKTINLDKIPSILKVNTVYDTWELLISDIFH